MSDFAATRTTHRAGFADRVRGEVVEVHIALFAIFFQRINGLCVVPGTEGERRQHLSLTTRKHSRSMDARQKANIAVDLTNVGRAASIGTLAFRQDQVT